MIGSTLISRWATISWLIIQSSVRYFMIFRDCVEIKVKGSFNPFVMKDLKYVWKLLKKRKINEKYIQNY